jgi:flagellar biosynthesis/type III secretory pathway protein FliH
MSDAFVPLAVFLRPVAHELGIEPSPPAAPAGVAIAPIATEPDETIRAVRRFRAGLADALDAGVQRLLAAIAREVLARELRLGAAEVGAIVSSALNRFAGETILAVRAHPADLDALAGVELARITDDALQPGDILLQLRSGTIDLTLAARLEAVLAVCAT